MQVAELASHGWFWALVGAITGAGGFAGVYKLFLERKVPEANIRLSDAQAEKAFTEAHKIVLDDATDALKEAKATVRDLKAENEILQEQNDEMKFHLNKLGLNYDGTPIKGGNGKAH
jgi:hypothetical protein